MKRRSMIVVASLGLIVACYAFPLAFDVMMGFDRSMQCAFDELKPGITLEGFFSEFSG